MELRVPGWGDNQSFRFNNFSKKNNDSSPNFNRYNNFNIENYNANCVNTVGINLSPICYHSNKEHYTSQCSNDYGRWPDYNYKSVPSNRNNNNNSHN